MEQESEEPQSTPLLKPKRQRNFTDEQKAVMRERMQKVNADRIEKARKNKADMQAERDKEKEEKLKAKEVKQNLTKIQTEIREKQLNALKEKYPPTPEPAPQAVAQPVVEPKKKRQPKKTIKVVHYSSESEDSDSESDVSIPEADVVYITKGKQKKAKALTKQKAESKVREVETPVPVQPLKPVFKFL